VTRSDLLNLTSREFEYQFVPVWAYHRQTRSKLLPNPRSNADGDIAALIEDSSVPTLPEASSYYYHTMGHGSGMLVPDAPDHGIDLIEWFSSPTENATNPNSGITPCDHMTRYRFLQLKQYDNTKVSAPEVQAFIGACFEHQAALSDDPDSCLDEAYLVTTNQLTSPADGVIRRFNNHQHVDFDIVAIEADTLVKLFRRHYFRKTLSVPISEIKRHLLVTSLCTDRGGPFPLR
jgi:hypothetical protein